MKQMKKRGFTLIELLVVVLIIGLLAAIALPQYQKAVEKSRSAQAVTLLRAAYQAAAGYYMANGTYPATFAEMGLEVPWTGTEKWDKQAGVKDTRSNGEWSLQLYHAQNGSLNIYIGRLNGKYKGAGFEMRVVHPTLGLQSGKIRCAERMQSGLTFEETPGDYCHKIMNGTQVQDPLVNTFLVYDLP